MFFLRKIDKTLHLQAIYAILSGEFNPKTGTQQFLNFWIIMHSHIHGSLCTKLAKQKYFHKVDHPSTYTQRITIIQNIKITLTSQ